jgi:hypothetical protein
MITPTSQEPSLTEIRDSLAALEMNSRPWCNRSVIAHLALIAAAFLAGALFVSTPPPMRELPPITSALDAAGETLAPPPSRQSELAQDASLTELAITVPLYASAGALLLALGFARRRSPHHQVRP